MTAGLEPRQRHLPLAGARGWQRMAYVEWGDPGNPDVVVCVHGLLRNGRDFDVLARALAPRFRVVCPDVIGRGLSEWLPDPAEYGYPRYLADAAQLLARLDVDRVHWVGTSMGGIIGMAIAAQPGNPLRSLVLNDVGAWIPKAALEYIAGYVGQAPPFDDLAAAVDYLAALYADFGLTRAQWQAMAEHQARRRADGRWQLSYDPGIAQAFQGPLDDVDLGTLWAAGRGPTLVLRGADSRLLLPATLDAMLAQRPGVQSRTFAGCGHAPGLQDADQIACILEFLSACE